MALATGQIYVYGTELWWENRNGTRTYSIQGVRPSDTSLFSGQAAGRVWVASNTSDLALYYSDEFGVTRFIQGNQLAGTSTTVGTITTRNFPCPDDVVGDYAPDIYWVTEGPSGNVLMQARAEGVDDMRFLQVNTEIVQLAGTNNFEYRAWTVNYEPLLETMSFATSSVAPFYLQFYTDSACATPMTGGDGETKWAQLPFGVNLVHTNNVMTIPGPPLVRGSLPASPWFTTASLSIGSSTIDGQTIGSMKIVHPTMSIFPNNDLSRVTQQSSGSVFCNGGDRIKINMSMFTFPNVYQCITLSGTTTLSPTTTTSTTAPSPRCQCIDNICSEGCPYPGKSCSGLNTDNCYTELDV